MAFKCLIPATEPGFLSLSLSHRSYHQLSALNGDGNRRIGRKPGLFQPVLLQVKAGAAAVIGGYVVPVCVTDTGISHLQPP